ncbi:MAG TPA: hypothetical protein VGO09_07655 [Flavisolibacter sp.]|jgi:hypothetical protein|nr:hypothetical protein [Flavisolibacter sp.]
MNTSEKLAEYLESDENKLVLETNAQLLTLKEIVEELYCSAKGLSAEQFKDLFATRLENNKRYLFEREMKVVKDLRDKEAREAKEE